MFKDTPINAQKHGVPLSKRDFELTLQCLNDKQVCTDQDTQQHKLFKFSTNILKQCDHKKIVARMKKKYQN